MQRIAGLADDGASVKYVPNQGNAGDALIAAATWQFFDTMGIRPIVIRTRNISADDVVIYSGGGNLVPEYVDCKKFLERCSNVGVRSALILPHTIRGHEELLSRLDARYTIACRDDASLERVRASAPRANAIAAPDMALRLDVDLLNARCGEPRVRARLFKDLISNGNLPRYLLWRRALAGLEVPKDGSISVIRTDVEATSSLGTREWDVSDLYGSPFRSRAECDFVARDLLAFMRRARWVRTNRLHAGIAAALVGCQVTFQDNSYGKIRAVYETSLKDVSTIAFS
jgi:exopolysaccharide biosynthesis predicted pyruvyltransferase EpsI